MSRKQASAGNGHAPPASGKEDKMKYADMHCDTLMEAYFAGRKSLLSVPEAMTDIGRLCQGECMMQFFAIFLPCADIWEWYGRTPVPVSYTHLECERADSGELFPLRTGPWIRENA